MPFVVTEFCTDLQSGWHRQWHLFDVDKCRKRVPASASRTTGLRSTRAFRAQWDVTGHRCGHTVRGHWARTVSTV